MARDRVGNAGQDEASVQALSVVKYYAFAGQRLAMRRCGNGNCGDAVYLHGDHLGSVSLATDEQGYLISQARYTPYGQVRWDGDTVMPTKFAFTGQRQDGFGLMDYNARYYSPKLGRFISADSVVPNMLQPASFDRYSYVLGNPIKYVDPSGHATCEDMPWECDDEGNWLDNGPGFSITTPTLVTFTRCPDCSWTNAEMDTITGAAMKEANRYAEVINIIIEKQNQRMPLYGEDPIPLFSPTEAFLLVRGGPVNFERVSQTCAEYFANNTFTCWGTALSETHVLVFSNAPAASVANQPQFAIHELGHGFDRVIGWQGRNDIPYQTEADVILARAQGLYGGVWQQSGENNPWELFADTYIAWVYQHFRNTDEGEILENFMTTNVVSWFTTILANGGP